MENWNVSLIGGPLWFMGIFQGLLEFIGVVCLELSWNRNVKGSFRFLMVFLCTRVCL